LYAKSKNQTSIVPFDLSSVGLDAKRVQELADNLESVFLKIKEDIVIFNAWLADASFQE